ncbi:XRE family transcriptional regulator [Ignicoccus islandicus DSM 13165]|uniref:XRE family transcriptional regulator n=1 Tax=Ignicoccus islandicus DSM 13165 TaxID=940295 RepID=A0A0U3E9A7_9CREN|nr:helix-turn-helix transcriptional regulator [Ignicoccus islandicus]ALU11902.1 XRE family transcriptional regulator [Ignicoccus islandicus DSM 13165]
MECVEVKLRELRTERGISQESLAKAVGVSRQTIIAIEKGRYLPSLTLALKIAKFFNVNVESVFRLREECYPKR